MKRKLFVVLGVVAIFVISMSAFAHHGTQVSYDMNKAIDVKGVVTKFAWLNPHSQLYFDVKDKDGKIVTWGAEMRAPGNLIAEGYTRKELLEKLKPGTEVTVTGNPSKSGAPVLVFIKLMTTDGYCLCNNGGGGAIPKEGVDENLKYSGTPPPAAK
jgi:Family of unknown function (DUF6152)